MLVSINKDYIDWVQPEDGHNLASETLCLNNRTRGNVKKLNIKLTVLDSPVLNLKHDVSERGFCRRLQIKSSLRNVEF